MSDNTAQFLWNLQNYLCHTNLHCGSYYTEHTLYLRFSDGFNTSDKNLSWEVIDKTNIDLAMSLIMQVSKEFSEAYD